MNIDYWVYSIGIDFKLLEILSFRTSLYKDINGLLKFNSGFKFNLKISDYILTFEYTLLPLEIYETGQLFSFVFKFPFFKEAE